MRDSVTVHRGRVLLDGSLKTRTARPLNGLEIREAIETHLLTLSDRLLGNIGLLSDEVINLSESLRELVRDRLSKQNLLSKVHTVYPSVGWNVKVRVEQMEDHTYTVNGEVELDLARNVRFNIQFGESGRGIVMGSMEEEKIPTNAPDNDRELFNMPINADYLKTDGTVGKVDIRELRGEKRVAKTVDVGSGIEGREPRLVPAEIEIDGEITIGTKEILMSGGESGQTVVLPSELAEIDLIATPPQVTKEPPQGPLPTKGMSKIGAPNVKFKESK